MPAAAAATLLLSAALAAQTSKPRLVVLTDIGGDPDDQQSMVRLMTYANEFEIEGLIASASGTPGELKRDIVQPQLIREIVEAYGQVRPNLVRHAAGYPPVHALLRVVKAGSAQRGVAALGAGRDTEGSRWITAVADRADPRPVNVAVWGGAHDLAQALWRVRNDRTAAELERFVSKLRVHSIGHQDDTGPWIVENFPGLFFILSSVDESDVLGRQRGARDRRLSVYRGMYLGGDESLTSREWLDANVRTAHGPLGALYPPKTWTAPNPHGALKEGDTPSWFYFLRNGLGAPEHPEWGSWGGRFRRVRDRYFNDAEDTVGQVTDARATVWRWRRAYQNGFAARMDWCAQPARNGANHAPQAVLNGERGTGVVRVSVRPGAALRLFAQGSSDADGDALTYRWFHYAEASGQRAPVDLGNVAGPVLAVPAERLLPAGELHIILEVTDGGTPALTAYRRAIVRVGSGAGSGEHDAR
jgi:hypothetical protein